MSPIYMLLLRCLVVVSNLLQRVMIAVVYTCSRTNKELYSYIHARYQSVYWLSNPVWLITMTILWPKFHWFNLARFLFKSQGSTNVFLLFHSFIIQVLSLL